MGSCDRGGKKTPGLLVGNHLENLAVRPEGDLFYMYLITSSSMNTEN
jgi:hypothetical protein